MNTIELEKILFNDKYLRGSFIGVFPCNRLDFEITTFPASFVVNTDPDWKEGEHWVCFYIDENKTLSYFDSFGFPPLNDDINQFFKENGEVRLYNSVQLQGILSTACGHYCIVYLVSRSRKHNMNHIVTLLESRKPGENDKQVMSFVNNQFNADWVNVQGGGGGCGLKTAICQGCKSFSCCNDYKKCCESYCCNMDLKIK